MWVVRENILTDLKTFSTELLKMFYFLLAAQYFKIIFAYILPTHVHSCVGKNISKNRDICECCK